MRELFGWERSVLGRVRGMVGGLMQTRCLQLERASTGTMPKGRTICL